ncbi:MAG TPA: sigma-70 family RNA polymerase sigma factor [Myxococcaceae bacterium]|nr:sigma-70 family RNA polymerase sigma factor [Myxococcaceae bacterium]
MHRSKNVPRKQVSHPEELELIQRLRKGDQRARTALVRRYHSGLLRQAFLVLRDEALAQDVVQDAWLGAFKSINRFDGRSSLLTWLIRIVVNKARSRRSREFRSVPFSALVPSTVRSGAEPADHPMDPEMPVEASTPEWLLLEREAVKTFEGALRALPASQRSVVVLRDLKGASSAETCRALQINDLTQRVRLSRARATLRLALQGSGPRLVA